MGDVVLPDLAASPELTNRCAYTVSLWDDLESVYAYTYNAAHGEAFRHRREWMQKGDWPSHVAWWVPDDHIPTHAEASRRWERLREFGARSEAFDFRHPFDADGRATKLDRDVARVRAAAIPLIDWQGTSSQETD